MEIPSKDLARHVKQSSGPLLIVFFFLAERNLSKTNYVTTSFQSLYYNCAFQPRILDCLLIIRELLPGERRRQTESLHTWPRSLTNALSCPTV